MIFLIRHLRGIISKKGIPDEDLQELSRDRGMRALGLTRERLERQYLDWIELSQDPKISVSIYLRFSPTKVLDLSLSRLSFKFSFVFKLG